MPELMYGEIRARLAATSEGPWTHEQEHEHYSTVRSATSAQVAYVGSRVADAEFIAHAPTDIQRLLTEAQIAADVLDGLTWWIDRNGDSIGMLALQELNALLDQVRPR